MSLPTLAAPTPVVLVPGAEDGPGPAPRAFLTPARLAANQANARRSTGPKTPEGKARARANAYRHGMTGAGVVVLEADAEEVDRLSAELAQEVRPAGPLARILVRRVAVLAVRLEEAAIQQRAATQLRVRHAEADFDADRLAAVDLALAGLAADPAASVRALRRSPEGLAALIGRWEGIAAEVAASGRWDRDLLARAAGLLGHRADDLAPPELRDLADLFAAGPPAAEREELMGLLREYLAGQVAGLAAELASFDFETLDLDRAEAPERALVDPDRAAALARRYEVQAERTLLRMVHQLQAMPPAPEPIGSRAVKLPSVVRPAAPPPAGGTPGSARAPLAASPTAVPPTPLPPQSLGSFGQIASGGRPDAARTPRSRE